MKKIKIKDIPETEKILFATKATYHDRSLIGIPSMKTVKFVITDRALYVKIAGVLIDLTGTERLPLERIIQLKIKNSIRKSIKYLTIVTNCSTPKFTLSKIECDQIIQILTELYPNIIIEG